ncbi:MAG: hypothetical protein BMS9Abin31_0059 [Gammaproteobacteria bacterium]|nr:MAG: hypothetical protein BMS9Abin31_0059 [Gammaproteobacteria bacterium]
MKIVLLKKNATALNDFSLNNKISYTLGVTIDSKSVNISDLDKNMNEKLKVTVETGDLSEVWIPIDNKNIYILLRE